MKGINDLIKRIGIQILFDIADPKKALEYTEKHGLGALELNMTSPPFFPENIDDVSRKALISSKIPILLHAPNGLSLFNLHKKPLDAVIDRLLEIIDFAHEIKARCLTIHLGSSYKISVAGELKPIHEILPERYEFTLRYSLERLSEYSRGKTLLCVENTSGFRYDLSLRIMREFLNREQIYLTWDIGHTNRLKGAMRDREIDFMQEYSHLIRNCHIHDNHGGWDEHNIIGEGNVDFDFYLSKLVDLQTYLIIEVRPRERAIESYIRLKKILQPML